MLVLPQVSLCCLIAAGLSAKVASHLQPDGLASAGSRQDPLTQSLAELDNRYSSYNYVPPRLWGDLAP